MKEHHRGGRQLLKNIAYQLLHGTAEAHKVGVVHRDIKLANVLMTETWPYVVRLCDWGSALAFPMAKELQALYAPDGPTADEETEEHQPPEVKFDKEILAKFGIAPASSHR